MIETTHLQLIISNNYVDLEDIEHPIKRHAQRSKYLQFETNTVTTVYFRVKRHEVILDDALIPWPFSEESMWFRSLEVFFEDKEKVQLPNSDQSFSGTIVILFEKSFISRKCTVPLQP